MKIKLTSVFVDDQDKALKFYTEVLGFVKKQDFPVGEFKWLTVVSPDEPDGPERASLPTRLFETRLIPGQITGNYDVAPDGQRFLIPRPVSTGGAEAASAPITVVLNWNAGLKK